MDGCIHRSRLKRSLIPRLELKWGEYPAAVLLNPGSWLWSGKGLMVSSAMKLLSAGDDSSLGACELNLPTDVLVVFTWEGRVHQAEAPGATLTGAAGCATICSLLNSQSPVPRGVADLDPISGW